MPVRVTNLALPVEGAAEKLPNALAQRLGCRVEELVRWKVLRRSLDARQHRSLRYVFTIEAQVSGESERLSHLLQRTGVEPFRARAFHDPPPGSDAMEERPIVVGSGPAGLLAGYFLAWKGYRPLILERGQPVKERVPAIRAFDGGGPHDPENNYLFGEGGAGAFSDGKLTCRMTGSDVDWVLERIVECGGRESIVYENRPHLGSNKLPMICRNFRRKTEALGGEYRFGCRFEGLDVRDGRVVGVQTSSGRIPTKHVVLAIGHSARDTYEALHAAGLPMEGKAFQLGLRVEQPQEHVNRHEYGRPEYLELLGAASYSLVAKGQRDLFTFCMCAGGWVIPSVSEPGMFCTNGMSNSRHETPFANSGLVVTLDPKDFGSDHPLAGVEVQRHYERLAFELAGRDYICPIQSAADFLAGRTPDPSSKLPSSYERGTKPMSLAPLLPPPIAKAVHAGLPVMDRKWKGQFLKEAMLVGPEMRGSSPVRIPRDNDTRECPGFDGLYPVGEGAGYAGGIISAAVDGLRSARAIVERFAPVG